MRENLWTKSEIEDLVRNQKTDGSFTLNTNLAGFLSIDNRIITNIKDFLNSHGLNSIGENFPLCRTKKREMISFCFSIGRSSRDSSFDRRRFVLVEHRRNSEEKLCSNRFSSVRRRFYPSKNCEKTEITRRFLSFLFFSWNCARTCRKIYSRSQMVPSVSTIRLDKNNNVSVQNYNWNRRTGTNSSAANFIRCRKFRFRTKINFAF